MNSYKKLCTEFYDLDKPHAPEEALTFLLGHLASIEGPILEPMSGSGRFLIPLLQRGFNVEGFDASPEMLAACHARCVAEGLTLVQYEGFLGSIRLAKRYGMIFILSGSFGLITDRELVTDGLDQLFEWLTSSGKLIIEIETDVSQTGGLKAWNSRSVARPDGAQVVCRSRGSFFPDEGVNRIECVYQLVKDEKLLEEETEKLSIQYYDVIEFSDLLRDAGFSDIECFRPYGKVAATPEDDSAVYVCRKA